MKKIKIILLLLILEFISCRCSLKNNTLPQIQSQNIVQFRSPKIYENPIEVFNFNGKFGEVFILNKSKFNIILKNNSNKNITINNITFTNTTFKFDLPYPGISTASTKLGSDLPCGIILNKNKRCIFSVTFQPVSERVELGKIVIDFTINTIMNKYTFEISGVGKEKSFALKELEKLKTTFSKVAKRSTPNPPTTKIIKSILANGHSNKFVYDDFFASFNNKSVNVLQKQLSVNRTIGYTYRSDFRPPEKPWINCDDDWKKGFSLKDPISSRKITYPGHSVGTNCGIKDIGGFFPSVTRKKDIEKINKMLINYKKETGKNFDPSKDNFMILNKYPNNVPLTTAPISDQLNWWLQSVLNLSGHVFSDYSYKGFISTSTNINFIINNWSGGTLSNVYVVYQEGGYLLPNRSNPDFNLDNGSHFVKFNENEVAVPGAILWEDVMAYVSIPEKDIMVRDGFEAMDKNAYDIIINDLSYL
ncbi:hypothetical protein [Silvanigrella aquatica]|uniref:Uncharacterized protein n=1 Tax=Silvanigrella aquatica TaxID=1915309 RepID=A0A1L4CZJ2_9BACT|nr:hypothetical protein [Silvanigrella aquatica]APJ03383.1 hypothetical protein AXG55_05470 [Silvanigrella aquatica]